MHVSDKDRFVACVCLEYLLSIVSLIGSRVPWAIRRSKLFEQDYGFFRTVACSGSFCVSEKSSLNAYGILAVICMMLSLLSMTITVVSLLLTLTTHLNLRSFVAMSIRHSSVSAFLLPLASFLLYILGQAPAYLGDVQSGMVVVNYGPGSYLALASGIVGGLSLLVAGPAIDHFKEYDSLYLSA